MEVHYDLHPYPTFEILGTGEECPLGTPWQTLESVWMTMQGKLGTMERMELLLSYLTKNYLMEVFQDEHVGASELGVVPM